MWLSCTAALMHSDMISHMQTHGTEECPEVPRRSWTLLYLQQPGQHLYICHVDPVHIAALFLVHFDGHKVVVEQLGDGQGGEGLPLHDVTPAKRQAHVR